MTTDEFSQTGAPGATAIELATHRAPVKLGALTLEGYVLEDGTAVLTARGIVGVLTGREAGDLGGYIDAIPLDYRPAMTGRKREFRTPTNNAAAAHGYTATTLTDICRAYVAAWRAEQLHHKQVHLAERATDLLLVLADVGITALVYAATGYVVRAPPSPTVPLVERQPTARELAAEARQDRKDCLAQAGYAARLLDQLELTNGISVARQTELIHLIAEVALGKTLGRFRQDVLRPGWATPSMIARAMRCSPQLVGRLITKHKIRECFPDQVASYERTISPNGGRERDVELWQYGPEAVAAIKTAIINHNNGIVQLPTRTSGGDR